MNDVSDKLRKMMRGRRFHKGVCYLLALLVTFCLLWLFFSQQGYLARKSMEKTVGRDNPGERVVKVYSGNALVETYDGNYSVEAYQGRLVIINRDNGKTVDVWGDASVVIDTAKHE